MRKGVETGLVSKHLQQLTGIPDSFDFVNVIMAKRREETKGLSKELNTNYGTIQKWRQPGGRGRGWEKADALISVGGA